MSLATALADSSAFLAITSNVPTSQMNRAPFQELYKHNQADFPNVLRPVVKRSFQPTRVDMLPLALRQAFDTMVTGRPGPVNLDIPYNVYQEEADVAVPPPAHRLGMHRPAASSADVAAVMGLLKQAQRPVFFIGHGATLSEAGPELTALSQRLGIPVITSPNGMGCVPADDVLTLGFIGRNGAYPANQAGRHADLVITIGTRFDDRSSSSWHAGLFVELSRRPSSFTSTSIRRSSVATIRPTSASSPIARRSARSCSRPCDATRRGQRRPIRRMARAGRRVAARVGGVRAAQLQRHDVTAAAGIRRRHAAGSAARRRDPVARLRRAP